MIKFENISKKYKIKKGKEILALDNISLNFPNKG